MKQAKRLWLSIGMFLLCKIGLTVIANAPNPAGQSILKKHFENGVSPVGLLKAAIVPTAILWLVFLVLG